jgi:hypothetical protein
MWLKRLVVIGLLPCFLASCAEFYGSQPPAPIHGGAPKSQKQATKSQKKSKSRTAPSKQIVKTQPLKEFSEIKPEPLLSPALPTSEPIPVESAPIPISEPPLPTPPVSSEAPEPSLPTIPIPPVVSETQESLLPSSELTQFEPIEPTVELSPAVGALVSAADQNSKGGDLDSAAASIERAIRIEPRNATLFYKLALLRLKQSKPHLAEDLAKKSALLASTDNILKRHCWLLIAHARELQQDFVGAKEARAKADGF